MPSTAHNPSRVGVVDRPSGDQVHALFDVACGAAPPPLPTASPTRRRPPPPPGGPRRSQRCVRESDGPAAPRQPPARAAARDRAPRTPDDPRAGSARCRRPPPRRWRRAAVPISTRSSNTRFRPPHRRRVRHPASLFPPTRFAEEFDRRVEHRRPRLCRTLRTTRRLVTASGSARRLRLSRAHVARLEHPCSEYKPVLEM